MFLGFKQDRKWAGSLHLNLKSEIKRKKQRLRILSSGPAHGQTYLKISLVGHFSLAKFRIWRQPLQPS